MELIPTTQGHSTAIDGWGSRSNKHLFDWIVFHETVWDQREDLMRDMDPKMRNLIVEQRRLKLQRQEQLDFFQHMTDIRETVARTYNTGWKEDVERDEGGRFTWLKNN